MPVKIILSATVIAASLFATYIYLSEAQREEARLAKFLRRRARFHLRTV